MYQYCMLFYHIIWLIVSPGLSRQVRVIPHRVCTSTICFLVCIIAAPHLVKSLALGMLCMSITELLLCSSSWNVSHTLPDGTFVLLESGLSGLSRRSARAGRSVMIRSSFDIRRLSCLERASDLTRLP